MSYIPSSPNGIAQPAASAPVIGPALNVVGQPQSAPTTNYEFLTGSANGWYDALAYSWVSVTVATTAGVSAGAVVFECTNDPTNAPAGYAVALQDAAVTTASKLTSVSLGTNIIRQFEGPVTARYFRVRVSSDVSGSSVTVSATFRQAMTPMNVPNVGINSTTTGTNTIGTVMLGASTSTMGLLNVIGTAFATDSAGTIMGTLTSSAIAISSSSASHAFTLSTTAVSGSSATLDVIIQESYDGANFFDLYHFERLVTTGFVNTPQIRINGSYIRYQFNVSGTSPSFTYNIGRVGMPIAGRNMRQYINRSLTVNVAGSTTPAYFVQGTNLIQLLFCATGGVSACSLYIQGSDDGAAWYNLGNSFSTAASGLSTIPYVASCKWVRAQVNTAGNSQSLSYLQFTALGP